MSLDELSELKAGNIILRKISIDDTPFISEMFTDELVRKYYIVPKEARQDYRNLVRYWLHDISQGAGYAWIIIERGSGLFAKDKVCGFFAFEYRGNLQTARISYAVRPEHRRKNIATQSAIIVIEALKSLGTTSIEADVDKDNVPSEKNCG